MRIGPLEGVFLTTLKKLSEFTGNYGIGIILLTVLIRVIILPLTIKQEKSMKKMRDIQPEVDKLREKYLEKQCTVCKNKVPNEGIVLRVDELGSRALKLKSFAFLQKETKDLDKGNVDMEEEN